MMDEAESRRRAADIAKEKFGFQVHLAAYLLGSLFFFIVWLVTGQYGVGIVPWFVLPIVGWGLGVSVHFICVYGGQGYVQRHIEKEYQQMKGRVT